MDTVVLQAIIDKDHRLIVDLPAEIPIGPVTVTIQPVVELENGQAANSSLTVAEARQRLKDAGLLVTEFDDQNPVGEQLSPEEMDRIGRLLANDKQSFADLINEDREPRL